MKFKIKTLLLFLCISSIHQYMKPSSILELPTIEIINSDESTKASFIDEEDDIEIETTTTTDAKGNKITTYHYKYGTTYQDEDGITYQEIEQPDGITTYQELNKDGAIVYQEIKFPDGNVTITTYKKDGTIDYQLFERCFELIDGTTITNTYDQDGILKYQSIERPDGSISTKYWKNNTVWFNDYIDPQGQEFNDSLNKEHYDKTGKYLYTDTYDKEGYYMGPYGNFDNNGNLQYIDNREVLKRHYPGNDDNHNIYIESKSYHNADEESKTS